MYTAKAKKTDGTIVTLELLTYEDGESLTLSLPETALVGVETLDFAPDLFIVSEGDDGYYIIPQSRNEEDAMLTRFVGHAEGTVYEGENPCIPVFGIRHPQKTYLAEVTGMPYSYQMVAGVAGGVYFLYPRFLLRGETPYEPISVTYHRLPYESTDYSAMAVLYRNRLLARGVCTPIATRENEVLRYAKESLYVRIRQAWKPVPSPVAEQTRETEPPLHVACTFRRVEELMEAYHARGIDCAEFCLVGWNRMGHDGRWPETFPVEPALGGEEDLRHLIARAKELGYHITCHTNSNSAYSIAEGFTTDWLRKDKRGNTQNSTYLWAGGLEHELCPRVAAEQAEALLPRVAELGFVGLHYVDVLGLLPLKTCYDRRHPVNYKEAVECNARIAALSRDLFGGFSSEGARAHMASVIDFGLYISYFPINEPERRHPIVDEHIPLWQLIYHGIVLSNPYTDTVNAPVKGRNNVLALYERGGRPALYYYSKFVTEKEGNAFGNWMGNSDFICDDEESLAESADRAAALYHEYREMAYLQSLFMDKHERLSSTAVRVTYSDGSQVTVDYAAGTVRLQKPGDRR